MKKKIGTILDEKLLYKAKQVALSQRRSLSGLFEDAVRTYIMDMERRSGKAKKSVVESTRGVFKIQPAVLKKILEEDIYGA